MPDPADATAPRPVLWFVPYFYILRVQVVTAVALIGLPFLALYPTPSPLLGGLFDLDYASPAQSAIGMMIVALAAFATAWTLLATTWTTIVNAPARFGVEPIPGVSFPMHWPERELFAVSALPVIVGAIRYSWGASGVDRIALLLGATVGLIVAVAGLLWANRMAAALQRAVAQPRPRGVARPLRAVIAWLATEPNVRDGYLDADGQPRPGHVLAIVVFTISAGLYTAIGLSKFVRVGYPAVIPTLADVLLLVLALCWAASGLAFFFDRYRVPVLVPLLVLPWLSAWIPWSDHYYRTAPHAASYSVAPAPLLALSDAPIIVVAANGGGIQAGAWAARVLTGLVEAGRPDFGDRLAESVRMISSVSGGGVGAMYFVNAYRDGRLPADLEPIVAQAEASSLDDVAWGVAYPDLLRLVAPAFRVDRGQALEWAWTRDSGLKERLAQWRDDVYGRSRPANIFNATIVDTGERLLIGTARVGWNSTLGLRNFEDLYPGTDVQIVTAARLSASFTYVSPAARADVSGPQYHVVDGGYYDNYGMTTLMEWLQQALQEASPRPKRVLVVQIRGNPPSGDVQPDAWHGWFYQAWAPVEAMLAVRSTGQLSHNEEEFARLQEQWGERGVELDNAVFQFCGSRPPLSWHLTAREKQAISTEWQRELTTGGAWPVVRAFLGGQAVPSQPGWKPCP